MFSKNSVKKNIARCIAVGMAVMSVTGCKGDEKNHPINHAGASASGNYAYSNAAFATSQSATVSFASGASACASSSSAGGYGSYWGYYDPVFNTEEYEALAENSFRDVTVTPLSTFAADVDTASYANLRRFINSGYTYNAIPKGAVRIEEMINYFSYDYQGPQGNEPFGVNAEISECPWNEDHLLVHLGLKTEDIDLTDAPECNLVFLIDVSGSMNMDNKLPLLKKSFDMLLDNLNPDDTISIVTYANGVNTVLDGVKASDTTTIKDALDKLEAGGGTHGEGGIEMAYQVAEKNFIEGGNNRVILATDGDFNIGKSSDSELSELIKEKKESGVFLSVLGYGMGNYSDMRMETLADDGNGNYAYIDSEKEAKKVLVNEISSTLLTVAKDVKFQVEFNPVYVSEYRLVGYENRIMASEDFKNDKKDGGEVGAGQTLTVLYEIVPAENSTKESGLRYQNASLTNEALNSNEWLTLSIRYKDPDSDTSEGKDYHIGGDCYNKKPSDDFKFAASVAEFGMVLTNSEYLADGSGDHVIECLSDIEIDDEYKMEFTMLVEKINQY